jgi:hypothetical protein
VTAGDIEGIQRWVDEVVANAVAEALAPVTFPGPDPTMVRIATALETIAERLDANSSNGTFDVTTREAQ